jgi:hypothetical protein
MEDKELILNQVASRVLSSKDGKKLLDLLEEKYIINTPVAPHFNDQRYAYFREGENNMIRTLKQFIEVKQ